MYRSQLRWFDHLRDDPALGGLHDPLQLVDHDEDEGEDGPLRPLLLPQHLERAGAQRHLAVGRQHVAVRDQVRHHGGQQAGHPQCGRGRCQELPSPCHEHTTWSGRELRVHRPRGRLKPGDGRLPGDHCGTGGHGDDAADPGDRVAVHRQRTTSLRAGAALVEGRAAY